MKVHCPHCNKIYNISEDALPQGKTIAFHCKECNGLVKIDLRSKAKTNILPRLSKAAKPKKPERSLQFNMPLFCSEIKRWGKSS